MCGLFGGYSSFLSTGEVEVVENLGILSQLRGKHSAGVVVSSRDNNDSKSRRTIRIRKCLGSTSHLFGSPEYGDIVRNKSVQFIIGHARYATSGNVTTANAHPFKVGNIYGVHNGTISKFAVPKEQQDYNSDSRILFNKINSDGLKSALNEADDGAYAICFYDLQTDTLNFIRNGKRSLYYMEYNGTLYWASESSFLKMVIDRTNGFGGSKDWIESKIYPFLTDRHYSLKVGQHPSMMKSYELKKREEVASTPKTFLPIKKEEVINLPEIIPPDNDTSLRGVDLSSSTSTNVVSFETVKLKKGAVITEIDKKKMKKKELFYRGFNYKLYNFIELTDRLAKGCALTGVKATLRDKVMWVSENTYILSSYLNKYTADLMFGGKESMFEGKVFTTIHEATKENVQ